MSLPEIIEYLLSCGFTQKSIAKKTNTTQATISRALSNKTKISFSTGKAIETLYNEVMSEKAS